MGALQQVVRPFFISSPDGKTSPNILRSAAVISILTFTPCSTKDSIFTDIIIIFTSSTMAIT